jgi:hypothetical protein
MSFKDFKIIETIGKGSFASVYKVTMMSAMNSFEVIADRLIYLL